MGLTCSGQCHSKKFCSLVGNALLSIIRKLEEYFAKERVKTAKEVKTHTSVYYSTS